jgi:hypothetical protein
LASSGAAEIWQDKLPENAPCVSQKDIVDYVYARTSLQTVDMFGALSPHAGENIYYRRTTIGPVWARITDIRL